VIRNADKATGRCEHFFRFGHCCSPKEKQAVDLQGSSISCFHPRRERVIPNSSPSSPLPPTTGTPRQTPSHVTRACSNAPVGWHTVSAPDNGSSGNHGQSERGDAGEKSVGCCNLHNMH